MNGTALDLINGGKPWPRDAVMIVAADAGQEIRAHMRGVVAVACRDCGRALHADPATIEQAEPLRRGRPVRFFCVECCVTYDRSTVTRLIDNRGGRE